ncbi:MAG TPA: SagB family peptide dehydrogenase [Thermoanaerobaculia bacterium]|nr:SagB family peptide dehydrogenase [Thermoanaerobaculia bacterium]
MPRRYVVSRFVTVSWSDGDVQITSPVVGKTFTIRDASLLQLLSAFAEPRTIDDYSSDVATVLEEWIATSILVDADATELAAAHHWDRAALALHASSRDPSWRKTPGHKTPAIAPRRSTETIALAKASAHRGADLATLLDTRRSRREWANAPIAFQAFSDLFWLSARNRGRSRAYPSGGAAYSLELYPVVADDAVETLARGVYRYLPDAHALELVSAFSADSDPFLIAAGRAAGTTPPPMAIIITSRYARQSEEYTRLAYSLVLKEVGCLFQTLYLAAESLGLAACALGGGTPRRLLAELCGMSELEEPIVGEFALGARR